MNKGEGAWVAPYRSLWKATGWWGTAWAAWVALTIVVQAVLWAVFPGNVELRKNVNTILSVGVVVLMAGMMHRIQTWRAAHSSNLTPPATPPDGSGRAE